MNKHAVLLITIISILSLTGSLGRNVTKQGKQNTDSTSNIDGKNNIIEVATDREITRNERFTSKDIMTALFHAYPDRISQITYKDDDWAVLIDSRWFYYAEGRLLPENLLNDIEKYDPHPFYPYPDTIQAVPDYTEEQKLHLRNRIRNREERKLNRHPGFYNAIWEINDRQTSWDMAKTVIFLGKNINIHHRLMEDITAVEFELKRKAKTDVALQTHINSITGINAYNWRQIQDTRSVSFHSYGAAIDILTPGYYNKNTYWLWTKRYHDDWFLIPNDQRNHPPESFIEAFEKHGFIWGGKWLYFDTIHFEYRPEILFLNNIEYD